MGYRLDRLDEPGFIAVSKPLLTEFDIHYRLESCEGVKKGQEIAVILHVWSYMAPYRDHLFEAFR